MRTVHKIIGPFLFPVLFAIVLFSARIAQAGMPMPVLTRYGMERIIGMSTALFILLVVAAIPIRLCWNSLVADPKDTVPDGTQKNDSKLPMLTYPRAVAVTFLGGCLFLLVLVMIAGSRELLSPGAWIPDGAMSKTLYHVERERLARSADATDEQKGIDLLRRDAIIRLRDALALYSREHEGRLPDSIERSGFGELWQIPFAGGMLYEYLPDAAGSPLVREPEMLPDAKFSIGREFEITEAAK